MEKQSAILSVLGVAGIFIGGNLRMADGLSVLTSPAEYGVIEFVGLGLLVVGFCLGRMGSRGLHHTVTEGVGFAGVIIAIIGIVVASSLQSPLLSTNAFLVLIASAAIYRTRVAALRAAEKRRSRTPRK